MDPEKIAEIINWPSPKSLFEVRSFHGLASFYRKFIRNFSEIYAHMWNQPFHWTDTVEESFQLLKKKITESPLSHIQRLVPKYSVCCHSERIDCRYLVLIHGPVQPDRLRNFVTMSNSIPAFDPCIEPCFGSLATGILATCPNHCNASWPFPPLCPT